MYGQSYNATIDKMTLLVATTNSCYVYITSYLAGATKLQVDRVTNSKREST